ncbi:lytic transglycosylase domain-containing protein [bacterium LRH843]|nr:lytic transglycosylase domain-containing protein [bacterium LRH843]
MKRWIIISFIVMLSSVAGYLYVKNEQLNEELRISQEMEEMQQFYAKHPMQGDIAGDYNTWINSKHLSEKLYEDSEGAFKKEWGLFLGEMAQKRDIDPYIIYELLRTESGFDPNAVGPETRFGRAYGMAQFMTNTAPWIAEMAELPYEEKLLFDPLYSIQLSVEYVNYLYNKYQDWDKALTAYNRGMYGLENYMEEYGHAESLYAVEIQENAKNSKQMSGATAS